MKWFFKDVTYLFFPVREISKILSKTMDFVKNLEVFHYDPTIEQLEHRNYD